MWIRHSQFFFRSIDLFGLKTELTLDHKLKYTSTCGGILTVIYVSLFILLFITTGNDMIHHLNPISSFTKDYSSIPEPTPISKEGYFFIFGLQDSSGFHFYDESIYKVDLIHRAYNSSVPFTAVKTYVPLERCTLEHLPSDPFLKDWFKNLVGDLSQILCIAKEQQDWYKIKGSWDNLNYENIQVVVSRCQNSSDPLKPICKSNSSIDAALKDGYFGFYSTDTIVDLWDFERPGRRVGLDYYTETNMNFTKNVIRYLSSTNILSDIGWILSDPRSYDFENFEKDHESFYFRKNDQEPIIKFLVRKGNYKLLYQRYYKKIQNVLAEMGGFLKITFLIFSILSYPLTSFFYYENISNTLYSFQNASEENELGSKKLIELNRLEKQREETKILNHPKNFAHLDLDRLYMYFNRLKEKPLDMPLYKFLLSFFSNDADLISKKNQRKKALKSIFARLDIKFFLKKMLEIDKLKFLLLNSDQLQIFDNLPRPLITKRAKININSMDPNRAKSYGRVSECIALDKKEDKTRSKMTIFVKCFTNIVKKPDLDEIDKKFIDFIGDDLKEIMGLSDFLKKKHQKLDLNISLAEKKESQVYIPDKKEKIDQGMQDNEIILDLFQDQERGYTQERLDSNH